MANPPPIPPPPAGFWWRTLACLADILPLMFLASALVGLLAGQSEKAAQQRAESFVNRISEQYIKVSTSGNLREVEKLSAMVKKLEEKDNLDRKALISWYAFQANVSFVTMLIGLSLQEWLLGGRTLGKRIFNLRTVSLPDTHPPGFLSAVARSCIKAVFITLPIFHFENSLVLNIYLILIMLLGIVNFHVPLFRRDKRAWHDLWTRTQVVDNKLP